VFKIGHENYRAGLLEQMERRGASAEEQRARLPNETLRDRVTFYFGGKEILESASSIRYIDPFA
jgi:hypothetical protein